MEIFLFFFISSLLLVFSGRFFLQRLGINLEKNNLGFSEQGFFGLIFFSFISLILNFFFKIDQTIATIILIFPLIQFVLEYKKIALKYDLNLTQMALNFVTKQNFVTSNIIGATSIEQLEENINSINCNLSKEVTDEIEKVHKIFTYPCP